MNTEALKGAGGSQVCFHENSVLMMMMYDGENDGDDDGGRRVTVSVVFMDLRKRVSWQASLRAAPAGTAMICRFSPKE